MALCDLCGKKGIITAVSIEGVNLQVCPNCSKYGPELIQPVKNTLRKSSFKAGQFNNGQPELKLVDNFSTIIGTKRETMGLTLAEFSAYINERESIVSKWQSGLLKPSIELAQKMEKKLNLSLLENEAYEPLKVQTKNKESPGFTLGDFIKTKKR